MKFVKDIFKRIFSRQDREYKTDLDKFLEQQEIHSVRDLEKWIFIYENCQGRTTGSFSKKLF